MLRLTARAVPVAIAGSGPISIPGTLPLPDIEIGVLGRLDESLHRRLRDHGLVLPGQVRRPQRLRDVPPALPLARQVLLDLRRVDLHLFSEGAGGVDRLA